MSKVPPSIIHVNSRQEGRLRTLKRQFLDENKSLYRKFLSFYMTVTHCTTESVNISVEEM